MRAFFGSMTGRVFLTLLLGIVFSAAITQLLAENERQRVIEEVRTTHALDRAEQLITATEIVPASARLAYLGVANRPGIRLEEVTRELPAAPQPSSFTAALAKRMGKGYQFSTIAVRPKECDIPRTQSSIFGAERGGVEGRLRKRRRAPARRRAAAPADPAAAGLRLRRRHRLHA